MLNEINMILSKATQQNIPQKLKQVYLDIYPMILYYIKRNTRRPNTVIDDLELKGFNNIQINLRKYNKSTLTCLYVTVKYRGIENDPDLVAAIHASNEYYGLDVNDLNMPNGVGVELDIEYLGPAQKVYENPEFEDDLEKVYVKLINSGALKSYSTMLKAFVSILDNGYSYPLYHGGKHTAGILNIKYPIQNRLSTSIRLNNYINMILDNSDKWKAYPKRKASIMFTDSSEVAASYGTTVYYIFPPNNAKIGICPKQDFWDVFRYDFNSSDNYYILSIHSINNFLQYFSAKALSRNINMESYDTFHNDIDKIETYIRRLNLETASIPNSAANTIRLIKEVTQLKNYSFFDFLEDFIKPNYSGDPRFDFKVTNTNNLIKTYDNKFGGFANYGLYAVVEDKHELWTDQPCLIITQNAAVELTEYVKKYGLGE